MGCTRCGYRVSRDSLVSVKELDELAARVPTGVLAQIPRVFSLGWLSVHVLAVCNARQQCLVDTRCVDGAFSLRASVKIGGKKSEKSGLGHTLDTEHAEHTQTSRQSTRQARAIKVRDAIDAMVSASSLITRLFRVSRSGHADLHDIIRLIESDQHVASRILDECNRSRRAAGADAEPIVSIRRAIVMLGLSPVRDAAMCVCAIDAIETAYERTNHMLNHETATKSVPQQNSGALSSLDRNGLWRHAVATACVAEELAAASPQCSLSPSTAFACGILSTIGRFALDVVLPQSYTRVLTLAQLRLSDSASIEREVLGIDHCEAAAHLCASWKLPDDVCAIVGWAENTVPTASSGTTTSPEHEDVQLVRAASMIARSCHLGYAGDFGPLENPADLCPSLGLTDEQCSSIGHRLGSLVAERASLLGLSDATSTQTMLEAIGRSNRSIEKHHTTATMHVGHAGCAMRVLASITHVLEQTSDAADLTSVADAILRSAETLFGESGQQLLVRPVTQTTDNTWVLIERSTDERTSRTQPVLVRSIELEHTTTEHSATGWIELTDPAHLGKVPVTVAPWLVRVVGASAAKRTRVLPLMLDTDTGCCALLLHGSALDGAAKRVDLLRAISTVWGSRIVAWSRSSLVKSTRTHAARTNEHLATLRKEIESQSVLADAGRETVSVMEQVEMPVSVIAYRADQLAATTTDVHVESVARTISAAAHEVSSVLELFREKAHILDEPALSASVAHVDPDRATLTT